jgi:hypothetical protein
VSVMVYDLEGPIFAGAYERARMDVPDDGNGHWQADFGAQGFDITEQLNVAVLLQEIDGGVSAVAAPPPPNTSPVIGLIHGPADPVMVNTAVQVSADFSDPDADDTHTATWDWGDGTTSNGIVGEENGVISGSHTYTTAGIYTLGLTLCDAASECDQAAYQDLVVYDSAGGFVIGGGWINSPAGAYTADPSLAGKANFGFVSMYKKGASVPTGNTEFRFKVGDLNFHSTGYQGLVVNRSGVDAQFKGYGTINGAGNYEFMIWVKDGRRDTFRIKIWDANDEVNVVYDSGAQLLGGGNIAVHKCKGGMR